MMRFRHLYILTAILFGLGVALPAEATQQQQNNRKQDSRGGQRDSPDQDAVRLHVLPIVTEDRLKLSIGKMFLIQGPTTLQVDIDAGVLRQSENRVNLSFIPLIGNMVRAGYSPSDFAPNTQVGVAYGDDRRLVVELNPEQPAVNYNRVIVLNRDYSFELTSPPVALDQSGQVPMLAAIPLLGRLFKGTAHRRAKTELLIMITPSIIVPRQD